MSPLDRFNAYPDWLPEWVHQLNWLAWVAGNVLVGYIAIVLVIFVIGYAALFDPKSTTGGKLIFRFAFSLVGVIGLVFIGVFIDPHQKQEWFDYPVDVVWWRPVVRAFGYYYVAYTVTSLTILLAVRKWWPEKIKIAPIEETTLVRPRKQRKK